MKTDARVRYTKMRIREAFLQCLKEKPVSRITVKELCEIAEINRATFYTHYADPFDLLEKLEEEALSSLRDFISRQNKAGENMLLLMLKGMQDPEGIHALLASPNGDPGFAAKITVLYRESFIPGMAELLPDASPQELTSAYRFIAGGCGSLISAWMESGMETPPEALAAELQELCVTFVEAFAKKQ